VGVVRVRLITTSSTYKSTGLGSRSNSKLEIMNSTDSTSIVGRPAKS
jgi:hypothetical protein